VFFIKNLLLLCAGVLAVFNFRRRTAVKRRALTNILSDPSILAQYKDRFPARKGLADAESIAKDYFATYFSRTEYSTTLLFHFFTDAMALGFVMTRIGFQPPILSSATVKFIVDAAAGRATTWALVGSYLWNCYDLILQTGNFNLRPAVLTRMWLKLWVAAAVAAIFSDGVTVGLQPALGFAVGLVSIPALFGAVADKSGRILNIKTTEGDATTPIKMLQGATPGVIDTFADVDIESTEHLAYCDPIQVMMSANLGWMILIDLIDQSLLSNYLGADMTKIRSSGYRGSIEVATIGANLNGTTEQKAAGAKSLTNFATLLGWAEAKALDLVQTLYFDSQVNLIWDMFGGNYQNRDKTTMPVNGKVQGSASPALAVVVSGGAGEAVGGQ
jgi:hypothetical protein